VKNGPGADARKYERHREIMIDSAPAPIPAATANGPVAHAGARAIARARSIEGTMTARLRYGGDVKIDGSEIRAALSASLA
jgi:hypothetical protein